MKSLKLLKRRKIIALYHYFLARDNAINFAELVNFNVPLSEEVAPAVDDYKWISQFQLVEDTILTNLEQNLKSGWDLSKVPAFEKALLATALYEIRSLDTSKEAFEVVNQAIHFSKKYFDFENYKYINKILDIIVTQQFANKNQQIA